MPKGLKIFLLLILVLWIGFLGALIFTPLPFYPAVAYLKSKGFQVGHYSGSLFSGLEVSELSYAKKQNQMNLDRLAFVYSGPIDLFIHREMIFENIEFQGLRVNIQNPMAFMGSSKSKPSAKRKEKPNPRDTESNQKDSSSQSTDLPQWLKVLKPASFLRAFKIEKLRIADISFETIGDKKFTLPSFEVDHYELTELHSTPAMKISSARFEYKGLQLNSQDLLWDRGSEKIKSLFQVVVSPEFASNIKKNLRARLDFSSDKNAQNTKLAFRLFDNQINLSGAEKGSLETKLTNFNPGEFLAAQPPIRAVNFSKEALQNNKASFQVGRSTFIITRNELQASPFSFLMKNKLQHRQLPKSAKEMLFSMTNKMVFDAHHKQYGKKIRASFIIDPLNPKRPFRLRLKTKMKNWNLQKLLSVVYFWKHKKDLSPKETRKLLALAASTQYGEKLPTRRRPSSLGLQIKPGNAPASF